MADPDGASSSDDVALEENEAGGTDEECVVLEENDDRGGGESGTDDALVLEPNDANEAWELVHETCDEGGSPRETGSDDELILEENETDAPSHAGPPPATPSAGTAPTTGLELLRADDVNVHEPSALELFNASVPSGADRLGGALAELPLDPAHASALAAHAARLCVLDAKEMHGELKVMGVGKLGLRQKVRLGYISGVYLGYISAGLGLRQQVHARSHLDYIYLGGISRQVVNVLSDLHIHLAPPVHLELVSPPPVPPETAPSRQPTDPIDGAISAIITSDLGDYYNDTSSAGESSNDDDLPNMAADPTFLIWQVRSSRVYAAQCARTELCTCPCSARGRPRPAMGSLIRRAEIIAEMIADVDSRLAMGSLSAEINRRDNRRDHGREQHLR